jgi:hypothetical protein
MLKTAVLAAALLCAFFVNAEARQRHHAPAGCKETGTVMNPSCTGRDNSPFSGAVKIDVVMHKVRHAASPRPRLARETASLPGIVRSVSGATAHVAASATQAFQCLVDRLDAAGYPVRFLGGWRAHGSVPGSLHPAGLALDVNQIARNVTRPAMPSNEVSMANECGLISGRQWRWADSGHFQLGGWAGSPRHYASRHRQHQYASAR